MEIVSLNPSNGMAVGKVGVTALDDVSSLVDVGIEAQARWGRMRVDERISLLTKGFYAVEQSADELAKLLSLEMGKDIRRSMGEVMGCAQGGQYLAAEVKEAIQSEKLPGGVTVEYCPHGVVGVISPWNYPLAMANNLIVPALVSGNTVVFKPSEETPLIAQDYVKILNQFLPEGVLQIIYGGKDVGVALVESNVSMIAFTGSMAAGKDIMRRASGSVKRLIMELGGNDPMVVLDDSVVEAAARFAVASSFENAGQMCTSTERVYVDEKIADVFEERVVEIARQYKIGPWDMPTVNIGPIINEKQRDKVIAHIQDAVEKGAKLRLGGEDHPDHFIRPTVITETPPDALMESEETFGPVVSISRFERVEEAIQRANGTEYGLGAVVFGSESRAREVGRRLIAGMVGINGGPGAGHAPWVGAKQSGFGYHGSIAGHRQFTQLRVLG